MAAPGRVSPEAKQTRLNERVAADHGGTKPLIGPESAREPVQIAAEKADLTSELKRGLSMHEGPHLLEKRSERRRVGNAGHKRVVRVTLR
jgi:hypothetical protein